MPTDEAGSRKTQPLRRRADDPSVGSSISGRERASIAVGNSPPARSDELALAFEALRSHVIRVRHPHGPAPYDCRQHREARPSRPTHARTMPQRGRQSASIADARTVRPNTSWHASRSLTACTHIGLATLPWQTLVNTRRTSCLPPVSPRGTTTSGTPRWNGRVSFRARGCAGVGGSPIRRVLQSG